MLYKVVYSYRIVNYSVYLAKVGGSPLCGVLPACVTVAPCVVMVDGDPCLLTGV